MSTILIIAIAIVVLIAVGLGVLLLSVRRGGKLAQKVGETAMRSERVRNYATEKAIDQMADDPDLIEQAIAEAGGGRQARRAVERISKMRPVDRKALLHAAESGQSLEAIAQGGIRNAQTDDQRRAAAKRKAKARAARKQSKRTRRH